MFNVAVIKLKDLIKYLIAIIVILIVIYMVKRYFFVSEKFELDNLNIGTKIANAISSSIINAIDSEIPIINAIYEMDTTEELIDENEYNSDEEFMTEVFTSMIGVELGVINANISTDTNIKVAESNEENTEEDTDETTEETNAESEEEDSDEENSELELASTDVTTEVVTENPITETYTDEYQGVKIKNETDFELTEDILNPDGLDIDSSNVIIFHTHTCESYTSSDAYSYTATGNFRTTDLNYSVARVGDELATYLTQYGFNTIHDKTYHDYPAYNGSYTRSLETVSNILESTSADIIIDLHRDAIGSNSSYAPTVKIGDDYCAQIMFVMGTNGGGLYHPNWQSNLKFAIMVQKVANELYPGLFKPIIVRDSRYNQHLAKAACIIEVGATGNTLEQCLNSMKYLSEVMNKVFN